MKIYAHERLTKVSHPHLVKVLNRADAIDRGSWVFSPLTKPNLHPGLEGISYYKSPLAKPYLKAEQLAKEWAASKGYLVIHRI